MVAFPLGSCQVRLGFSCFALLSFCCLFLGADGSAFFLAAAACHEAAHVAMLFWLKAPPAAVQVTGRSFSPTGRWRRSPWLARG